MATHSNGISALSAAEAARSRRAIARPGCWPPNCASGDGRSSDRNPLSGLVEIDKPPCLSGPRTTRPAAAPGESMTASCSWSTGIEDGRRQQAGPIAPGRSPTTVPAVSTPSSPVTSPWAPPADGWAGYAGVPVNQHDPHVIGPWPHSCLALDPSDVLQPQGLGPWGLSRAAQEIPCKPISTVRSFRFATQNSARHFGSLFAKAIRANPVIYNMLVRAGTYTRARLPHFPRNHDRGAPVPSFPPRRAPPIRPRGGEGSKPRCRGGSARERGREKSLRRWRPPCRF